MKKKLNTLEFLQEKLAHENFLHNYEILPVQVQALKTTVRLQMKFLFMNWYVQPYLDVLRGTISFGK